MDESTLSKEKMGTDWTVCVRCYTFNHAPYIKDAMDGFSMQQTDFPYVCCIADDASTDGEQDVIRKYIEDNFDINESESTYSDERDFGTLIFARHKTNRNCYFAAVLLKENHNGTPERKAKKRSLISQWEHDSKYEAICEGDDYWTDPRKLQKQVDFLEAHPDYSMCFHKVTIRHEGTREITNITKEVFDRDYSADEVLSEWIVPTCSAVMRIGCIFGVRRSPDFLVGDNVMWATCAVNGKMRGLHESMATYRRIENGWTAQVMSSRSSRYAYYFKWIGHYKAMKECFPEIDKEIFDRWIVNNMASISTMDLLMCKKGLFRDFKTFYAEYKNRYLKETAKSIGELIKSKVFRCK